MPSKEPLEKAYPNLNDFLPFLDELNRESPRGMVLMAAGFLEEQLRKILLAFMMDEEPARQLVEGYSAPLGTFSARIGSCFALGLVSPDEHHDLTVIRRIRNDFAHRIVVSFDDPSIRDRCATLRSKAHDYARVRDKEVFSVTPAGQFSTGAIGLILNLVNRPHYVELERRSHKRWPY